jgi:hypothetical protein
VNRSRRRPGRLLPLGPLLTAFRGSPVRAVDQPAWQAIRTSAKTWLNPTFLDAAADPQFGAAVAAFHAAVEPVPLHRPWTDRRGRFLRHALNHLLRGQDPLAERLARCIGPEEPYFVAGLGPTFWAAVAKAIDPDHLPLWCPAVEDGLRRLGLLAHVPATVTGRFDGVCRGYETVRATAPDLFSWEIDEFLERVGRMADRELPTDPSPASAWSWQPDPERIRQAVRQVRVRTPLRKRLKDGGEPLGLPDARIEAALPRVDDAYHPSLPVEERSRLLGEVAAVLRERFRVHPLEVADVLGVIADEDREEAETELAFGGFCTDTFRFLAELPDAKSKEWMAARRDRYLFVLREPLVELCQGLADRYVRPVLNGEYGWDLECDAKPGRALTSICKNDFGRSSPYQPVQWITFYRRSQASKRADAQFFVRVAADGVTFGFHLGQSARAAGKQFRRNVQDHAEPIFAGLNAGGATDECRFWTSEELSSDVVVRSAADLRAWATNKTLAVGRQLAPDSPLLRRDELVGEVLLTFDRLVPAFACAAEADPRPLLLRRAGSPDGRPPFDRAAFTRETLLSELWIERVLGLLRLKRQLILQGVPGTGKTHVARCLARLLAHDRPESVRLVQFHPAYTYEEFVEGIRARNVEVNGRSEVTYPVEDGVLCEFAARAAARPSEPHVLVIDELNRGNLPRIFGELLYLLEYREQALTLPYSKRSFRLPDNLLVVATMNTADRSAVALDQALRRRFSFVEMTPDPALLAGWLEANPPADPDGTFGPRVVRVFEELNRRLARDLGPERQVGHSFFMVPGLDEGKLAAVWEHHVRPLLLDSLGGRQDRLADYERLFSRDPQGSGRRTTRSPVGRG